MPPSLSGAPIVYGVYLPGCTSAGDTRQQAALSAKRTLQAHIELSVEHGEVLPKPSGLDTMTSDPDVAEAARILVRAELPDKTAPAPMKV